MANRKPLSDGLVTPMGVMCDSVTKTLELGADFGRVVAAGGWGGVRVFSLEGGLGAGKTHFVKGVARGLGFAGEVSSPTFTLVHEYVGGRLPVYHFDWYRLEEAGELAALGFEDYLDGSGVVLLEWGDRFPEAVPTGAGRVTFLIEGESRRVRLEGVVA